MKSATTKFAILTFVLFAMFAPQMGHADAVPTYCTDASGARYIWTSAECKAARAALAASQRPEAIERIPGSTIVLVPGGTNVVLRLSEPLSSATATAGDVVQTVVDNDVVVNGFVVIPKGARGQATIIDATGTSGNGGGGHLALNFDWVFSADGGKIALTEVTQRTAETDRKGASSTMTILGYATFGLLGLFGHGLVHGREATIDTQHKWTLAIDHNVHVQATQRSNAGGFDQ